MSERLANRVVIITGAASGIGQATAELVAAEGGTAVVADIQDDRGKEVAEKIRAAGGRASSHRLDVASRQSWEELVTAVVDEHGGLHGLVNNAGITRDKTLLKMTDEDWRVAIDVNLTGVWLGCQHAVPHMKAAGGAIVNLSSESRYGAFGQSNYAAAKAGVVGLTRTVALEHARHNIRCNAVAPGTIGTPMVMAVPQEIRDSWLPAIPMRRIGEPEEVARVVAFLLSDESSYVTGHVLNIDGGSSP